MYILSSSVLGTHSLANSSFPFFFFPGETWELVRGPRYYRASIPNSFHRSWALIPPAVYIPPPPFFFATAKRRRVHALLRSSTPFILFYFYFFLASSFFLYLLCFSFLFDLFLLGVFFNTLVLFLHSFSLFSSCVCVVCVKPARGFTVRLRWQETCRFSLSLIFSFFFYQANKFFFILRGITIN